MTGSRSGTSRRARRISAVLAAALLATVLPLAVSTSGPAAAAADCLDESYTFTAPPPLNLLPTGCDDTVAPETTVAAVSPALSPQGYLRTDWVTVAFSGAHPDADTGTLGYECQVYATATAPSTWTACTSPASFTGLSDTTDLPYTVRVRAVDTDDAETNACDDSPDLSNPTCAGEEPLAPGADDVDPSPAAITFRVDTVAPNTFLDRRPRDPIRPDWPVLTTGSATLELNSNEPAGFACTLDGRAVRPCGPGQFSLHGLAAGNHTLAASAVDAAGNVDPTPETTTFFVPSNLRGKGKGWTTVRQAGRFGGDVVQSSTVGATLVAGKVRRVRELRLIALVGPRFGTVQVRIGSSQWYTVDLHAESKRIAQLVVRDHYSPLRGGTIRIKVGSLRGQGSSVRLDALVARR